MSNSRKNSRPKKERHEIAIQSDPSDFAEYLEQPQSTASNFKSATISSAASRKMKGQANELIQSLQRAQEAEKQRETKTRANPLQARKSVTLNMMRLQDKNFDFDKNIFNITIGEIANKQTYLSNLQEEIEMLKSKIQNLEYDEKQRMKMRTVSHQHQQSEVSSQDASRIERRSLCGRFYKRAETPNSQKQQHLKFASKQEQSTYFKWKPQIDQKQTSDVYQAGRGKQKLNSNKSIPQDSKTKSLSNYRVKQKNNKQPLIPEPVVEEQPEQLKKIFVKNPEWEIHSITDDFRAKMMAKLQIPNKFPIGQPDITDPLEQYEQKSVQIYKLFGINLSKCKSKLIVRKFKNGVYFQMKPNKNIVWYFNGSFYIGDWDTDLPSESEKNGFGFEYVPDKYYYLGQFKDGNRNGRGVIKILNKNQTNINEFVAYDGEWLNGKPHGFGKHIDQKNNKYMGSFENGEKTGKGVALNIDGLYYEGEMKNGSKNGKGVEKLVNGDAYLGNFAEGKFHGPGTYKWKNGSMYQGSFAFGKREGKGVWKSYNGDQFQGVYSNDMKHGWGKFLWKNGEIYEGEFRNDIRHGQGYYKHPSGKMGKYLWKDGHIDHRLQQQEQLPTKQQSPSKRQGETIPT